MLKRILTVLFIISLFSCTIIPIEDPQPDYAGTWIKTISSNSSIRVVLDEDSYTVSDITTSDITGISTTTVIERGTVTNATSTHFTLTRTHLYEFGSLVSIPVSLQVPSDVSWSIFGSQLTLVDNVNTYTNGTFTKL